MQRVIIPDVIDGRQAPCTLPPEATVRQAAHLMRERRVGAVMVTEEDRLLGIVTERDMVFRLLADRLSVTRTPLSRIMTTDPETVAPDDAAFEALNKMRAGHYRHLPVVEDGRILGMVSIRDLYECTREILERELRSAETLIYGEQYGMTAPSPH